MASDIHNPSSYDQLQSWTGHPAAVVKCSIQDIYEAETVRRNQLYAEPIFLLDQCPFRNVDIVGWVSSLSYAPVERDKEDPTMKMVMTVDDGNGAYVIPISKTLKHELVERLHRGEAGPLLLESPYRNGQRYMTIAERRKWDSQQKRRTYKRHIYPNINVGDVVRIRGRLKEWTRRNGETIREIVVDQDGGSIVPVTAWDEFTHFEEVDRRKREIYHVPFQAKLYESLLSPLRPTASQMPATLPQTQTSIMMTTPTSSQLSGLDPSDNSAILSGSASQASGNVGTPSLTCLPGAKLKSPASYQLRHPCKLSREHLNDSQFRRYLMEYLRIQAENHWCHDLESEQAIREAARYMPELAWPTSEVAAFQAEQERQQRKQVQMFNLDDAIIDLDSTPRATAKSAVNQITRNGIERRRPLTPVKFNGSRIESSRSHQGEYKQDEGSNCSFGLEHLVHVPHLRIFAHRFVRLEQSKENDMYMKRRKELKAAAKTASGQPATDVIKPKRPAYGTVYRDSRARHAERGWKMRKLIQHCFRLMVATDGSVIEVNMSEMDKEEIQADAVARRARKGVSQSFEASYDSNGSLIGNGSFANTTLGDTSRVSTANASFDFSIWEAPSGFNGHPSDSDSSPEQADADKKIKQSKNDPTGYLPLTLPVLGMALLHILHEEAFQRSRVYIPNLDWRKKNGLPTTEVWSRLKRLHERWERCQLAVVEDGMEDLAEARFVRRWGEGWWPTHSRL